MSPRGLARPGEETRFLPGAVVAGRYRLVSLIGKGGMGEVYRADDLKLGQSVALKFLPPELEADESRLSRFLSEVRMARQISHPNVCRVHDIGEIGGSHYLSMEFVDGEDLASLTRRIGRLPEEKAIQIARQLCAGLGAAHRVGILHRDLKPSNIMIDGRGGVRITDFGLAGLVGEIEGEEVRAGTPAFMAPEQLTGKEVTVRSDIYALGLVLYELFTGRPAHKASSLVELLKDQESGPVSPTSIIGTLDPAIEAIVLRCLALDPVDRPQSALAVAAALPGGDPLAEALAAGETPSPEMVAAAGDSTGLTPLKASALLLIYLLGTLGAFLILDQKMLVNRAPFDKRPEVLESEARKVLGALGYEASEYYTTSLGSDPSYFQTVDTQPETPNRWAAVGEVLPSPVHFWYRQSPEPLVPENFVGHINWSDPASDLPGMIRLKLDTTGNLQEFLCIPPSFDEAAEPEAEPDWNEVIRLTGLSPESLEPAEPTWTPPSFAHKRAAWVGSGGPDGRSEVRVEAAAYSGKVSYLRVIGFWTKPPGVQAGMEGTTERIGAGILVTLLILVLIVALYMARRNLRLGRGDRKGAWRLSTYVLAAYLLVWAFRVDHVLGLVEIYMFLMSVALGLLLSGGVWVFYTALEPYLRRRWPVTLVSWNRVLSGRFGDPLVGRDVLYGAAAGGVLVLLVSLSHFLPEVLGRTELRPIIGDLAAMTSIRYEVALVFSIQLGALINPLLMIAMIYTFLILFRREWIAVFAVFALFCTISLLSSADPVGTFLTTAAVWLLAVYILTRFGVVSSFMMFYVAELFLNLPLTMDVSVWYFNRAFFIVLVLTVLVAFAFYRSLAGRQIFGDAFLEA
ncbi:MAG: serine/threonine protein kinase [Acidobacteriota bacterium]|nr:MAG: serine/threonine protein kinase [Acidobacteriota bacterium]